ncbi:MAG: hypothetical protein QOG50_1981 [Actinomycetota bacterium]|nr:hypothetical protein [Actinomycetota bacterium]
MSLDWPTFVLQRRINQPLSDVTRTLSEPESVGTGGELELGSHGRLVVDQRFSRAPFPSEASFVAQATLHTSRGQRVARVEVEVGAWSNDATVLTLRPVARNPQRWSGRRATRYFELAHEGADAIARLAIAS